ncbi:MAG: alpha/beta hydrolase [Rhodospirillaceae bacterium]|nr:MAG: alpha/beta hydrolase [Rhodospirillaceae bacterium]
MQSLLLLPGMMCDQRQWAPQIAALSDICDPILVGNLTQGHSVKEMAAAVLSTAPPRFALAGLSMGGIVAFELWRQAPKRITHLALLDTTARPDSAARQQLRMQQIGAVLDGRLRNVVTEELKPSYLGLSNRGNHSLLDVIVAMATDLGPAVFERQSLALKNRPDSRPMIKAISCPTLVLYGDEDSLCDHDDHLFLAQNIRGAILVVVPACGHLSTLESPDAVNAALRMLLKSGPNTVFSPAMETTT